MDGQRPGQIELLEKFQRWIDCGTPGRTFSVCMCCRYGKADAQRNMAVLALKNKIAGQCLAIHPYPVLAKQFLESTRVKDWRGRWLPSGPHIQHVAVLDSLAKGMLGNDEWIGSTHIQAVLERHSRDLLLSWVDYSRNKYKAPPLVFFDEGHHFSNENVWGKIADMLHKHGCLVVPLTATPFRNDKDDLFGFKKEKIGDTKYRTIIQVEKHPDPDKLFKHTVSREETEYVLKADVEVPFSQGWQEGCIAHATFEWIDWNTEGFGELVGDNKPLSELPKDKVMRVVNLLYRDPLAIREAANRAVTHLRRFRKCIPNATIIWYGMDDLEGQKAENQKQIRAAIAEADPNLNVAIATLATNEDCSEKSDQIIQKFTEENNRKYDALILKKMGAAGLDAHHICVVVLWNNTRSLNQMIQMAMRGGNSKLKTHFVIIALADCITKEKLKAFVEDQGGVFKMSTERDRETEIIDKKEKEHSGYTPTEIVNTGMSDTENNYICFEEVLLAIKIVTGYPSLVQSYSYCQVARIAKKMGITVDVSVSHDDDIAIPDTVDTQKLCGEIRESINHNKTKIGRLMFFAKHQRYSNGSKEDLAEYGRFYADAARKIKEVANIYTSWEVTSKERSTTVMDYRKWLQASQSILEEMQQ